MTGSPPARGGSWKDDQGHKWATVLFFGVDVSGKTAEPKMAFNFAHLLSAACGGAPRRLERLRRPWARCARLFWGG